MGKVLAGVVIGFGLSLAVTAYAVTGNPGDHIYESEERTLITAGTAATLADAFIAAGAWSGNRADMQACTVMRRPLGGFAADCLGHKAAAPGSVPIDPDKGTRIIGVIP